MTFFLIISKVFKQTKLQILDLSFNNLESLSPDIGLFVNLKQLYLNNNPLQFIPIEIFKCKNLQTLKLSDTYIKFLPREMADLKKLFDLDLKNCPISGKLQEAYSSDICSVFEYLQRKKDRSDYRVLKNSYILLKKLKKHKKIAFFSIFLLGNDSEKAQGMDFYVEFI